VTPDLAGIIFIATYAALAVGRIPGLRVDRAGAALIGAALMVALNVLTLDEAYRAVNLDTIVLLLGMMIVVANLRISGFFALVSEWVVEHAHRPLTMLAAIAVVSGTLSAFFVNDTVCLVLAPLVAEVTFALKRNPVPYLLAVAMASNAGSLATLTGNPQNMLIGSFSGIPYRTFSFALAPVAALSVLVAIAILAAIYWPEFRSGRRVEIQTRDFRLDRALLWKSLAVSLAMMIAFFSGVPIAKAAIAGGALLLLISRSVRPRDVYNQIDWPLLMMFSGLFIVVAGAEKSVLEQSLAAEAGRLHLENGAILAAFAAALSNIVSNVPAVLVFKPFLAHLSNPQLAWQRLAMASTLAGNLTVLGSVANLIVIEQSRDRVRIGFWEYARAGVPITIATLLIGIAMLR
jgi:Na+/H+ antiporter NhaD/arsenite permease-like protein